MIIRTAIASARPLFAIAYGILQNREEAEDAVQDALCQGVEIALACARAGKISDLLATIARHRAHDIFRKGRAVPLFATTHDVIEPSSAAGAEQPRVGPTASISRLPRYSELHRSALYALR